MYTSYLTRETFENEHDEKMTRKFSYNYQVLKRLFPEVYKLPESEIRSLVRSIYDNPKMGDELLDHLSDVINKRKPEWGEYLNPKPEEPEQPAQVNPLQPVQPKPLNTGSGFEPYKPQKSAFGLGNSGGFGNAGGLGNSSAFGLNNTNSLGGFGNTSGFAQTKLPDLTKGLDLKHSDMVTGFGINEAKQKQMLGTGFSMPKLPKMPTFPKAPKPEQPQMPQFAPAPAPQFQQPALTPNFPQTETAYSTYTTQTPMAWAKIEPRKAYATFNGREFDIYNNGELLYSIPAMSGKPFYQCKDFVGYKGNGPLPEGLWEIDKNTYSSYPEGTKFNKFQQWLNKRLFQKWKNDPVAWGYARARIIPQNGLDTMGRDGLFIHGGDNLGSAGCIDLTGNMSKFQDFFERYPENLDLFVKYDKDCW